MALTKKDVMNLLGDPVVSKMNFYVDIVPINSSSFGIVKDLIDDDSIMVVEGTNPQNAFYHAPSNTLTTQNKNPPADLDARALLLHECTHALIDVMEYHVTALANEVTCYIAQHSYLMLSNPSWTVAPNNAPWFNFFKDVVALVKKFGLDKPQTAPVRLTKADIAFLLPQLNHLNLYQHLKEKEMYYTDGVMPKTLKIRTPPEKIYTPERQVAYEEYPQPSDEYLERVLKVRYAEKDVAGYGKRIRELANDFKHVKSSLAKTLVQRFEHRIAGDKVSMYFHDHLSTASRTALIGILKSRI